MDTRVDCVCQAPPFVVTGIYCSPFGASVVLFLFLSPCKYIVVYVSVRVVSVSRCV